MGICGNTWLNGSFDISSNKIKGTKFKKKANTVTVLSSTSIRLSAS